MAAKNRWEEYQEKKAAKQTTGQQEGGQQSQTKKNRLEEYREKKGSNSENIYAVASSITDRVNTWLQNHNNYIKNYQTRNSGRKYSYEDSYVSDSGSWLDTVSKQKSAFDAEADSILAYMDQFNGYLDADWMKSVRDTLTSARGQQNLVLENTTKDNEWWSSFKDETEYQTAVRYDGYNQKYKGATSEDIQTALDTVGLGEERDWLQYYKGDIVGNTIRSSADFQKYASQGAKLDYADFGTEEWHRGKSRRQRGYNSIDKYRAASLALSEHYGNEAPLGSHGQYEEQVAMYRTMKDEEFENLAYYIAYDKEHGTNMAEEYVDIMEETLSQRRGEDIGEKVTSIDIPVIEDLAVLGYGALAGVNNFAFGVEQFMSDEELAHYPSTYANAYIADSLDGLGYYAHSAATTVGNMAPSILLSSALSGLGVPGKIAEGVGSATMGVSAAGNAYKDALSKGYDKDSARTYSNLVGASEGVLQYLIGGVSKLGGVSGKVASKITAIDNALLRGAAKLGVNIVGEIAEEEIQNFLEPAFRTILFGEDYDAPTIDEIIETAIVTMLSTGALEAGGTVRETKAETALNQQAVKEYGEKTDALIQEGLESDQKSESYKLAQKYQQQVQGKDGKAGKAMTGYQIRNLLAANQEQITPKDMKLIQQAAEKRLTDLGQTEDVAKVAELAARYATGGKLSKAEKNFLASSKYGSRVYNELLPQNIMSGDYSTEWAEEIGTKQVNRGAYNKKAIVRSIVEAMSKVEDPNAYKSLESRVEAEEPAKVSDTGKAVIRATDEEIDLASPTFKQISEDGVTLEVNGKAVNANEIDYGSEDQGLAINSISKIEHITPAAATALYAKLDMAKPVMEQLNGMDEAFTYGFYNYSEADLEAGTFAGSLTQEQKTDAYKLGQYVAKNTASDNATTIKKMRTAADSAVEKAKAEGKEAPKGKKLSITYNHGGGVVEDITTAEKKLGGLNKEQRGGIEVAKILHQLGIGTDYELFTSYRSKTLKDKKGNPLEVFLNDEGQEQAAYAGVYMAADGKIRINLNAYSGTKGLTLNALSHELTHFIKAWSPEKYKAMAEFLVKAYGEKGVSMNQLVLKEQSRLEGIRGEEVSYGEAYDEVVANAFNRMLEDGKVMERIAEIRQVDKSLAEKIIDGIRNFIKRFLKVYQENQSLFMETEALMEMKEVFEHLQEMFAEALVDASDNFQASLIAKEAGLDVMPVEASTQYSYQSLAEAAGFSAVENEDGTRSFVRDGKKVNEVTVADIENSPIGAFINFSVEMKDISEADAKRQKEMFAKICTMACKTNDFAMTMQFVGSAVFTGMKANADKQYGTTYDFPSICTKTQAVIDAMSAKMMALGRGLTTDEIVKLYDDVFASGNPVPCPECYVFSRWIGIGGLLDNIKKYQDYYGNMAVEDVAAAYLKMKAEVSKFADEQGISFGKAKGALTSKLTKEFNKLTEKIEKAENQGEKVKPADRKRLEELEPMMNTVKGMTWLENVYFADSSLKKVNPNFRVPDSVLFDLNNGEAFATKYKEAWAFRTTQGAGYGKAITPYAEARLGEGVLVTNNTTNAIKGRAQGTLNNYFLDQKGKLDKQSRDALKRARLKQKIQAFIGGQRFQSTSDARYENASDYLLAALEMQAMGGMVQCYTKVDGAVHAFSAWGFSINQSLMPLNGGLDENGNVKDTAVGGMKPSVAFDNRDKHETAGTITIGVNDNHIRAMFKQWVRDFIIPYHASGGKATVVAEFRRIQEGKEAKGEAVRSTDYSRTQSDKVLSDEVLRWQGKTDAQIQRIHEIRNARIAILTGGKVNMTVVRSNRFLSALYDKLNGGEWDGVKLAKSKVESQIFPNEFWDQAVTYEESAKITKDYLEYCEDLGFLHRFSGMIPSNGKLIPANGYNEKGERVRLTDLAYKYDENGNMTSEVEPFFWKVLTDRRMYDNSGNYLPQKVVTLNDTTAETVTGFAKNNQGRQYDKAKAEALANKILKGEQYSSQETDLDRITLSMTDAERAAILNKKSVIAGVYDGQAEVAIKRNKADLDSGKIGLVKSALVRIGDEFGIFTDYDIADVDVKIQLSKSNIKESVSKDITPIQIAKLLPVLKTAVENAIGIESHANRYFYDDSTVFFENLLGGYVDGEYFVPVRFGLKHSTNGEATLYVIVDQQPVESKKIKAEVVKIPGTQSVSPAISRSAFKISVANLARFVNGKDLLRYLPDNMLSAEQKKTKWEAIAETVKKTNDKNDAKYIGFLTSGNLRAAQNMVNQAAKVAGYTIKAWHGSRHIFDRFSKDKLGSNTHTKASHSWFFAGDKETANSYYPYGVMKELARQNPNIWKESDAENMKHKGKLYELYLKMENPLIVDVAGYDYAAHAKSRDSFMEYVEQAERNGNDGIILYHVRDNQLRPSAEESTVYMFREPSQAKSADSITYDEQDNVVPISERFNEKKDELRYSSQETDLNNAPVFYSQMGKVVEGMKQEKFGASSVISMLRGKGVKAEEIRWSGIQAFLEGKKSVTKAELLEFIKGSMLQIEEQERGVYKKYSPEQQKRLNELEHEIDAAWDEIWDLWEKEFGEVLPMELVASTFVERRVNKIIKNANEEAGTEISENSKRIIELARQVDVNMEELETISNQVPETKWGQYKLDGGSNYRELLFKLPDSTYSNTAMKGHWGEDAQGILAHARMQDFEVDGKEMLFIEEIQSDWHNAGSKYGYSTPETQKLIDEFSEIRSKRLPYHDKVRPVVNDASEKLGLDEDDVYHDLLNKDWNTIQYFDELAKHFSGDDLANLKADADLYKQHMALREKINASGANVGAAPEAPFKDGKYTDFVLKRLLRMAAEEGYDSIGWTTAEIQDERWANTMPHKEGTGKSGFLKAYAIEYDQDIPKFLKKYGKQWGAEVGKTLLNIHASDIERLQANIASWQQDLYEAEDDSERDFIQNQIDYQKDELDFYINRSEVWSMDITDAMKKSVLTEGQALYSSQQTDIDTTGMDENAKAIIKKLKTRAMDSRFRKGVYASYSAERIERELNRSSATQMDYAKSYIAWIDADDFLYATTTSQDGRDQIEQEAGELDLERLRKQTQPIHLTVDFETGTIVGHEGRHRMTALRNAGVQKVAVIIDAWNDDRHNTKPVSMMRIEGQEFDRYHSGLAFYVHDMLPLSRRYADATQKLFSEVNGSVKFSTQETDNITDRHLLANAFETISRSSDEYKMIQEYKANVDALNKLDEQLREINAEIRKIRFGKGEYDALKLRQFEDKAKDIDKEINRYDKRLLNMEASEPLRKVIDRERKKEAQKTKDHVKQIQQNKKVRAEQAELRHKIRKAIRDLDKILNRGNKKLNVKEDMKDFVSKALELADYIFTDHVSNDELIRKGITVRMTPKEAALVRETEDILSQLYDNADSLSDDEFTRLDAKRKANEEKLRDLLTAQRNERLNTPVSKLFDDLVNAYASLKNSKQDAVKAAYNEELEKSLRAFMGDEDRVKILNNMRVADMTTEELNWLYRAYTMVLTNVRKANEFHVKGMNETIDQMAGRIANDFSSRKIPDKKLAIAVQKLVNKMGWDYEKLYYALDRIGSEAFAELIMNIADSENTVMQDIMEAAAFRDQMVEKYGYNNWAVNKEIDREFLDNTGKKFTLNLGQLMALYAYSRREGALDHLEYGGFMFGEAALTNPRPADTYKINKAQCDAITSLLTAEQKAYAEDMQKFLSETMGEKGNEVSMLLYGIKMFGEKNYFPIHVAGQFKAQAQESQAKAAAGFSSMSNAGFTHEQNRKAKAPIVLEGFNEIWTDHVNEMSRYHGTVPALEDLRRVMNRSAYSDSMSDSTSIAQLMENSYGKEARAYFDNLYREANSGAITDKLQHTSKKLLSLFRKNSVAYSLSVLIQQPASLVRAYAMIDKKYFGFKGFGAITSGVVKAVTSKWNKAYADAYNEMLKYAPGVTMAKEIGGFDTATGGSIRSYLLDTKKSIGQKWKTGTAMEKAGAVMSVVDDNAIANLPNVADKIAWIEIWNACKRETVAKHKDLTPGSDAFMEAVGERFTEVIRATQVYDSIFAKSPMLKSKNLAVQYLVSFMNEPNTTANIAESALRDFMRGDRKGGVKKAAVLIHSIIFTGVLKSIVYAMRDDDEDETYIEKYIESLAGSLMDDFNALNYIPLARDVVSLAQGYDVERADMAIVADALDALGSVIKNATKETGDMTDEELIEFDKKCTEAQWKLAESLAAFVGIPVKNIRREIMGVMDHARIASENRGKTTKKSISDKVYDAVVESIPFMSSNKKSKTDKLYEAIMSGDQAYLGRLKSGYKDDDAYHSAIRKVLRENDARIHEAALAQINGDPSKRVQIAKQIIANGFDLDDVITAINSEISKLTDSGEETTKKVKGYYKVEDFVREAANGDTAVLGDIREDIINTAVTNGKTAEKAAEDFVSNVKSKTKDAYFTDGLSDSTAEKLLTEYVGMDEAEATELVGYWAFCKEYPEYELSMENVDKYHEFAEPAGISLDIYQQYVDNTEGLTTIYDDWGDKVKSEREQVLDAIHALPLTWQQKDALYLAAGYAESKIWDVPW